MFDDPTYRFLENFHTLSIHGIYYKSKIENAFIYGMNQVPAILCEVLIENTLQPKRFYPGLRAVARNELEYAQRDDNNAYTVRFYGHQAFIQDAKHLLDAHQTALQTNPILFKTSGDTFFQKHLGISPHKAFTEDRNTIVERGFQDKEYINYNKAEKQRYIIGFEEGSIIGFEEGSSPTDQATGVLTLSLLEKKPDCIPLEAKQPSKTPFSFGEHDISGYHAQLAMKGNQLVGINIGGFSPDMNKREEVMLCFETFKELMSCVENDAIAQYWHEQVSTLKDTLMNNLPRKKSRKRKPQTPGSYPG